MSNCLILDNGDIVIMASDSALSFFGENKVIRVGDNQKKIFNIKNHLIFCSGKVSLVEEVISFIQNSNEFSVSVLSEHLKSKNIKKEEGVFNIETVLSTIVDGKIKTFQLSEYKDFDIEEITNDDEDSLKIHSAGIKTKECLILAEEELLNSREVLSVIPNIYRKLSCAEIGGYLNIWSISNSGIFEISNNIPLDKDKIHSLVADVIVGRLLAGNSLTITNSNNNFTLDSTGATLNNAKFNIQTTNTKIIIDPNSTISFRIQKNQGGTFVDKFWVDNSGNVNFSGNLSGATGTFSGTLSATVGNIGTLVIDSNGLRTADGNNYLRGNGDLKWGGLNISGSSATFTGTIYADKIVGQVVNSQISNGAIDDSKVTSGLNAGKITQGTMSGNRLYGGTPAFNGITSVGSDLAVYGNLQVADGSILAKGSITTNEGYFYTNYGYITAAGVGMTTSRSISTPFGTRIITFSGGICVGFT